MIDRYATLVALTVLVACRSHAPDAIDASAPTWPSDAYPDLRAMDGGDGGRKLGFSTAVQNNNFVGNGPVAQVYAGSSPSLVGQFSQASTDFIALGNLTNGLATGSLRLANGSSVYFDGNSSGRKVQAVTVDNGDNLLIGDTTAGTGGTQSLYLQCGTSAQVNIYPGGMLAGQFTTTRASLYAGSTEELRIDTAGVEMLATLSTLGFGAGNVVTDRVTPGGKLQTTDATVTTIYTFAVPDNTAVSFTLKCIARNNANNGDAFYSEYQETVQRFGGAAPSLVGAAAAATNKVTSGGGSAYSIALSRSSNNEIAQVTGVAATTINWSCQSEATQVQ